jgi:adenine deaminase
MFSTDEEDIDEIYQKGHIDHRIRYAISVGVEPIEAIEWVL